MPKKRFDFNSAYAQLILVVFMPIAILSTVGAYLVESKTTKALEAEQRTLATAALIRYDPVVKELLPLIVKNKNNTSKLTKGSESDNKNVTTLGTGDGNVLSESVSEKHTVTQPWTVADLNNKGKLETLDEVQNSIGLILATMNNDQHILRVAVVNELGSVVASSDVHNATLVADNNYPDSLDAYDFAQGIPSLAGTAYGHYLGEYTNHKYWLLVDMDNEPLDIARLEVWLGLISVGLFTLLILLLSLNVYAKRWIAPIYDLRLHLQKISPETMYRPVNTESSGELNQLQQDLIMTLRRLYSDFQELKDHSNQTEEDLRDAFDEMEMQNIRIREARDQAISSSHSKSAFLANISHELRTPLNSIDGFINLLARQGDLTAEQELYVQTIRKSSAHLLALVNDVLDFSKIEAGKLVLDKHEFNLYAAIYDVMDMLSPLAAEKGLRMAVLYYNDVPNTIIGDALRIKQVLTNLVGNAIKFTDIGEVVVRVGIEDVVEDTTDMIDSVESSNSLERLDSPERLDSDMIHIAVQDTGHGISEAAKVQLFKSFSQGDPSITRQYGGTGLGLIISKQLTRKMGGNIGFYNNAQKNIRDQAMTPETITIGQLNDAAITVKTVSKYGATFWFSIPAHVELDTFEKGFSGGTYQEEGTEVISLPELRPFSTSRNKLDTIPETPFEVLAWIDHPAALQVFMAAISPLNIAVTVAKSLAGALEYLKERGNTWDWVLIDGGSSETREDKSALLKQIRLHYQGKLAIYGYQILLDATLLKRYKAAGLYQPLDKRQLYGLLDTSDSYVTTVASAPVWKGIKVLAVDDHLPNLLVLDALLDELSIDVVTANNGYDAVSIISQQLADSEDDANTQTRNPLLKGDNVPNNKIDLIFMDVQMPRMSGSDAVKKIRQLEARLHANHGNKLLRIPIVALTAQALSDERETLIKAGFDDYVGKPINRPQLLQILQRWLSKDEIKPDNLLNYTSSEEAGNRKTSDSFAHNGPSASSNESQHTLSNTTIEDGKLPVIDWKDALIRSANKPDLAAKLLIMMQDSVTNEVAELNKAWIKHDREQLAQIAHRILGASRYAGVPQIRTASQDFEDKCLLNTQHTTPAQFKMLETYYKMLVDSLNALKELDVNAEIDCQSKLANDKVPSENDMTWKMI